jgi:hypothetical protein
MHYLTIFCNHLKYFLEKMQYFEVKLWKNHYSLHFAPSVMLELEDKVLQTENVIFLGLVLVIETIFKSKNVRFYCDFAAFLGSL